MEDSDSDGDNHSDRDSNKFGNGIVYALKVKEGESGWVRPLFLVYSCGSLMLPEVSGCLAEMFFYVSAKKGGVGEAEEVADLFDAIVGLLQIIANVL